MSKCEPSDYTACQWTRALWSSVGIALLITGTFGNILNVVVLSRRRMRTFSLSVYLICISCGDCTFLWLGMGPRILFQGFDEDLKSGSEVMCKFITWIPATAAGFSVWTIVLMTIERALLTQWPVSAKSKLTRRNAIKAVLGMLVFCVSLTFHVPFAAKIDSTTVNGTNGSESVTIHQCIYIHGTSANFYRQIWPLIVLIVLNVIPMLIIFVGNLMIGFTILSQRRKLKRVNPLSLEQQPVAPKKIKSATKMLFLLCTMFMLTTLPFTIGNVILARQTVTTLQENANRHLTYSILRLILYCNFTFNFVLYFVSGTLFKQEWKSMMYEVRMRLVHLVLPQESSNGPATQSTYPSDVSSWSERPRNR